MLSLGHAIRMTVKENTDIVAVKRSLELHSGAGEPWYGLQLARCGIRQNNNVFRFTITKTPKLDIQGIPRDGRVLRIEIWRNMNADQVPIHPPQVRPDQILYEHQEIKPAA